MGSEDPVRIEDNIKYRLYLTYQSIYLHYTNIAN